MQTRYLIQHQYKISIKYWRQAVQKLDCKEEKEEADKISNPTSNTNKISIKYWKRAMQKLDCKDEEEEVEEGPSLMYPWKEFSTIFARIGLSI